MTNRSGDLGLPLGERQRGSSSHRWRFVCIVQSLFVERTVRSVRILLECCHLLGVQMAPARFLYPESVLEKQRERNLQSVYHNNLL